MSTEMSLSEAEKVGNLKADIVIIGSGGGLVAAAAAAEKGIKDIIVVEKRGSLGGVTRMAQGFFACESPLQQQEQVLLDKDAAFKIFMNWDHWARVNPRVLRAYVNKSGDTVRWFQKKGVKFELKMHAVNRIRCIHWPLKGAGPEFGRGAELIRVLTKECRELGVQVLTRTMAQRILRDARGNVSGLVAARNDQEFQIESKCVIIATGGFSSDIELVKKYCPDFDPSSVSGDETESHLSGDADYEEETEPGGGSARYRPVEGLRMAEEVGAAIATDVPFPSHGGLDYRMRGGLAFDKNEPLVHVVGEPYTVKVNKLGRRFVDESTVGGDSLQPDKLSFTLFDDRIRRHIEENGVMIGKGWGQMEKAVRTELPGLGKALRKFSGRGEESVAKIAGSWEEMAKWMGAEPAALKTEIDEYNRFCDQGYDEVFAKERRYLQPLRTPPFYGLRYSGKGWGETMGGIKVNERMEVQDHQYKSIPGLYAAGIIADGWTGRVYCGELPGTSLGFTVNSGRIAGESAAAYAMGKL
jgi:fumarate reductase flavoprotein subunit